MVTLKTYFLVVIEPRCLCKHVSDFRLAFLWIELTLELIRLRLALQTLKMQPSYFTVHIGTRLHQVTFKSDIVET